MTPLSLGAINRNNLKWLLLEMSEKHTFYSRLGFLVGSLYPGFGCVPKVLNVRPSKTEIFCMFDFCESVWTFGSEGIVRCFFFFSSNFLSHSLGCQIYTYFWDIHVFFNVD